MGGLILNIEPSPGIILQIFQSTPITISFKPTKSSYVRVTIPPRQKVPGFQGWRVGQKLPRRILRIRNKPFFFSGIPWVPPPRPTNMPVGVEWKWRFRKWGPFIKNEQLVYYFTNLRGVGDKSQGIPSWWLNHPFEKYESKWVHLPQILLKIKNIWVATT